MNFTLKNNSHANNTSLLNNYDAVTKEFCKEYYYNFNLDHNLLSKYYKNTSLITFMDHEFMGFNQLNNFLNSQGIYNFKHYKFHVNPQPVSNDGLVIVVNGFLTLGNSPCLQRFNEVLMLKKDNNNNFFIYQSIFTIVE
jgi:hypothetical protein